MRYIIVAFAVAATVYILMVMFGPAHAATVTETAITSCVRHAPTRTEPGYYDANKRWVPPKVIKGECVQWRTVTKRTVPDRPPTKPQQR